MVIDLTIEVQEEIDREEIITVEELLNELKKLEDAFSKKKKRENTFNKLVYPMDQQNSLVLVKKTSPSGKLKEANNSEIKRNVNEADTSKKPCSICEALGWPNRWHPMSFICLYKCWQSLFSI